MNIAQIICWLETRGKHKESQIFFNIKDPKFAYVWTKHRFGNHYCTSCEKYLYTEYDSQASLKAMRKSWKMWWEISG